MVCNAGAELIQPTEILPTQIAFRISLHATTQFVAYYLRSYRRINQQLEVRSLTPVKFLCDS